MTYLPQFHIDKRISLHMVPSPESNPVATEGRAHICLFDNVDSKRALQSVWLQGSVTGSMRISMQIWHWHSNNQGMVSLGTDILMC